MTSIKFLPNEANTPVTILVAGDVRIDSGVGIYVSGARATDGTSGINGKGGYGGPGGFLGADGAYQLVNFANRGGDGLGPGGGTGGIPGTTPVAARAPSPGTLVNPVAQTVAITAVGGQPVPMPAMGVYGGVDVILPTPGVTNIEFETKALPEGTTVKVTVKPRVGAAPTVLTTSLTQCNPSGNCTGAVAVDLPAGAYTLEARATFQSP